MVNKVVAGNDGPDHGPFPMDLACTFDGRTIDAPNGQAMSFSLPGGGAGTLSDLPVGASCVVAETDDDGAHETTFASADPNVITRPPRPGDRRRRHHDRDDHEHVRRRSGHGGRRAAGAGAATYGAGRSFTVRVGCTRTIDGRTFPIRLPAAAG